MRLCCTAQFVAAALMLSACGTVDLFGRYDLPESAAVADAPYPRLADVPEAPAVGQYNAAAPDPAVGEATLTALSDRALVAGIRARELAGPVIPEAERRRLENAPRRR